MVFTEDQISRGGIGSSGRRTVRLQVGALPRTFKRKSSKQCQLISGVPAHVPGQSTPLERQPYAGSGQPADIASAGGY